MTTIKQEYVVPITFEAQSELNIKAVSAQDAICALRELCEADIEEAVDAVCRHIGRDEFTTSCAHRPFKTTKLIQQIEASMDFWSFLYGPDFKDWDLRDMQNGLKSRIKTVAKADETADLTDLDEALRFVDVVLDAVHPAATAAGPSKKRTRKIAKKKGIPERVHLYAVPVTYRGIALVHVKTADEKEAVEAALLKTQRKSVKLPDINPLLPADPSEVIDLTEASKLAPGDKNWRMVRKSDLEDALMTERAFDNLMHTAFKCCRCGEETIAKVVEEFSDNFNDLDDAYDDAYDGNYVCPDCRFKVDQMDLEDQMDELLSAS